MVDLGPTGGRGTHGHQRWVVRNKPVTSARLRAMTEEAEAKGMITKDATTGMQSPVPTSVYLVDGNGGEYRMTLHGTHRGTAMLMTSPSSFRITPMMINTKHPDGKPPGEWDLIPAGSYGRSRGATPPTNASGVPSSLYSPMLECPCTDRKQKIVTSHTTLESGHCKAVLTSAVQCYTAVHALGLLPIVSNTTVTDATKPPGCFVTSTQQGYEALYNVANSSVECGAGATSGPLRSTGSRSVDGVGVDVNLDLDETVGNCTAVTSDLSGSWTCTDSCVCPHHCHVVKNLTLLSHLSGTCEYSSVESNNA